MRNLKIKRTIQADFTADQWELYTTMPGSSKVAEILNQALMDRVNSGADRNTVRSGMHVVMHGYRNMGAVDTEPCAFLEQVLDFIESPVG